MITEKNQIFDFVVKILYTGKVNGKEVKVQDNLKLHYDDTLENAFIKYKKGRGRKFNIGNVFKFFKSVENEGIPQEIPLLPLSGQAKIYTLDLREGDKIIISSKDLYNEFIYNLRNKRIHNNEIKKVKIINYVIIGVIAACFLIISAVILLLFLAKKKKEEAVTKFEDELLVTKINYTPNMIYRYHSNKKMNMIVDMNDIDGENFNKFITQYLDFFIIIRNENIELDEEKHIQRKWFSGYIGILNLTVNNGTDDMILIYDKELYKYLNKAKNNNLRTIEEEIDMSFVNENNNFCFIKINFYENGGIKEIFLPKNFEISYMIYINDIIKLIIPKISPELYINNITQKIEEFNQNSEEVDSEEEEEEEFEWEEMDYNNSSLRDLSDDSNMTQEIESENFVFDQFSDSNKIDVREIKSENSGNTDSKFSNITEFSSEAVAGEDAQLDNSEIKTYIYSIINEKGFIISIKQIQNIIMTQKDVSENDDVDEEDQYFKSQIYNENNGITPDESEPEDFMGQNFSINLNNISMDNINDIELFDNIENDYLSQIIFTYFDNFQYRAYIQNEEFKNKSMRLLENKEKISRGSKIKNEDIDAYYSSEKEIQKLKNKKLRNLVDIAYYGNKNYETEKVLYKYNFLGLKLEGIVVCKVEPSTGYMSNYFQIVFGFINFKFKLCSMNTNLHIIIERTNQMIYRFITLLYNSNFDLIERNKKYGNLIVDIEKNISDLFSEYFDYSGLFRESLNDMYNQVQNFSGAFFNELIQMIDIVHENFTNILSEAKNDEYDMLNQIRIVAKDEYIKYINNMLDIIACFKNNTLLFLDNVRKELEYINTFQIDILYDIIDSMYDAKLIFNNFIKNLFKAIEKGIIVFKLDIRDYIEEIIGDLLYLTDFLSINLNKNEILKNAIDENTRAITTEKLKDFRNIIIIIMDLLNQNIINDYDNEMSAENQNSIKFKTEKKIKDFKEEIDEESNDLIEEIKLKIEYINLYEKYSNNIEIINNINNKSALEFNNDIYNNVLLNLSQISLDFLNDESDLIKTKNILFSLTKKLTNEINLEINEINNHIEIYSNNYLKEKLINYHHNLYHFRKYFLDDELSKLINELKNIFYDTLKIHFKQLIEENYNLAFQYFNEEIRFFYASKPKRLIGTGFLNRYYKYKSYFLEFSFLSSSEEFLNMIESFFYESKNYIINYISDKIKSINEYYLNNEIYKNNFYLIEIMNNEIYNIIDNINNFFNEEILGIIQTKIVEISINEIKPYNEKKEKELDNSYNFIYSLAQDSIFHDSSADFVYKRKKKMRWYKRFKTVILIDHYNCPHQNNINKITKNLSRTKAYLTEKTTIFKNNYINKFDSYLNNYVNDIQPLYNNLYNYYEEKINNHDNIESILNDYHVIFNSLLINYSNEKIIENINQNFNVSQINNYLIQFEKNIMNIRDIYYQNYYLNDSKDFLEYPEEILLKINEMPEFLKENNEIMKRKINYSYKKRLLNIIEMTNYFIHNLNDFNYQYIITHININNTIEQYFTSKNNFLKDIFNSYSNEINLFLNNSNFETNENEYILNENNYDYYFDKILSNCTNFLSYFEEIIIDNFTVKNCTTIIVNNSSYENNEIDESDLSQQNLSNLTVCTSEKYQSDLNYSKYNFNVVKLRTEIYYCKTLIEIFSILFDELDYTNLIDFNQINKFDKYTNDKNVLYIYNETFYKLKEIKEEGDKLIEEPFEIFCEEYEIKSTLNKEYLPFFYELEKLLKYENDDYNNNITELNRNILDRIKILFEKFNETLYLQISLKNKYDYYSINNSYFTSVYDNYFYLIEDCFSKYKQKISQLRNNYAFYNILKDNLDILQSNKRLYIENIVNDFSKNFDYESIGFTYNLGKEFSTYLKKQYADYELTLIYDHYELFENNSHIYSENIINHISVLQNETETKLKNLYDAFLNNYTNDNNYTTNEFIYEIKTNYTNCINYNIYLYDNISTDLNYSNITDSEEYIDNDCNILKIIDFLLNKTNDDKCFNLSEINSTLYSNEIDQIINCNNNNNYNYSVIIFEKFDDIYKEILDNIINNITEEINSNYTDENYLYNYFHNYCMNYTLDEVTLDDLYNSFEDFEDMIFYINNLKDPEYKNLLFNLLVESFITSYNNITNNFILKELNNKIELLLSDKIDIYVDFLINKIKSEYNYYLLLLNNTEELGNSSKNAIINYFENLPSKINDSLYYIIEEDILFNIHLSFRDKKNIFINNYIDYYLNNNDEYRRDIYKINSYMEEIKLDRKFNKTIANISKDLLDNILYDFNDNIANKINDKMNSFYNITNIITGNIKNIVNNIITNPLPEEMETINELIINYTILVQNQNNRYNFKVGEKPFEILNEFIETVLEPPLLMIKEKYDSIEERLLAEITKIANNFPDCYSVVTENLIGSRIEIVQNNTDEIESIMSIYKDEIDEEISQYINKLIHYTFINGINTIDRPCEESYCSIPINARGNRRLDKEIENDNTKSEKANIGFKLNNYSSINRTKIKAKINKNINFGRKLEEYSSLMGALSEDDLLYYLIQFQDTLLKFNNTFTRKEYNNVNKTVNKFITKINVTYLEKLKRSFQMKLLKFSTILTEENYKNLDKIVGKQYYQIEDYVYESANLTRNQINDFINTINRAYPFILVINDLIYDRVMGYYKILYNTIQNKYELLNQKRLLKLLNTTDPGYFDTWYGQTYSYILETHKELEELIDGLYSDFKNMEKEFKNNCNELLENMKNMLGLGNISGNSTNSLFSNSFFSFISKLGKTVANFTDKIKNTFNHDIINNPIGPFIIPFPPFPLLQIRISPELYLGTRLELINNFSEIEDAYIGLDLYARAKVGLTFEAGIYIPGVSSSLEISISTGLRGILGSGKAGIKLYLKFFAGKFVTDLYYDFDALQLSFYVKYRISCPFFKTEDYLCNYLLFSMHFEKHKIKEKQFNSYYVKKLFKLVGSG